MRDLIQLNTATAVVRDAIAMPSQPLDSATRDVMETRLGHEFSPVRTPVSSTGARMPLLVNRPGDAHELEAHRMAEHLSLGFSSACTGDRRHVFHQVRIHVGPKADAAARAVGALAFTVGEHIVFAAGHYAPHSDTGRLLLAHELTHVLQQRAGRSCVLQRAECDTGALPATVTLDDCMADLNQKVNDALTNARKKGTSAGVVIKGAYDELGDTVIPFSSKSGIEVWARGLPANKANTPDVGDTKYKGSTYGVFGNTTSKILGVLAPTLKVNGILIGSDKLGHFFQQGYTYYMEATGKPLAIGDTDAETWGRGTESGILGLKITGVYSNGDLAANKKGLQFYRELEGAPSSLVFDIKRYIDKDWNEESNPNMYVDSVGKTVWSNLLSADTWETTVSDTPGGWSTTAVNIGFKFTVTGAANLTGTFSQPSLTGMGTNNGTILNGQITYKTKAAGSLTAIESIEIAYDWNAGGFTGKGIWRSRGERILDGEWGFKASTTGGGKWILRPK